MSAEPFQGPDVRGYLHRPESEPQHALVITHGAGSNANAPMLIAIAETLAARGWLVLRCDLPYRQRRPGGSPRPAEAAGDRAGLQAAAALIRPMLKPGTRVVLGGHSYGGRQASMLAAEQPNVADSLLLCSYPLHPPGQPDRLRTQHLDKIEAPVLFVHGTKDPFGTPDEMRKALQLVKHGRIEFIEGAGHDLNRGKNLGFLDLL